MSLKQLYQMIRIRTRPNLQCLCHKQLYQMIRIRTVQNLTSKSSLANYIRNSSFQIEEEEHSSLTYLFGTVG